MGVALSSIGHACNVNIKLECYYRLTITPRYFQLVYTPNASNAFFVITTTQPESLGRVWPWSGLLFASTLYTHATHLIHSHFEETKKNVLLWISV